MWNIILWPRALNEHNNTYFFKNLIAQKIEPKTSWISNPQTNFLIVIRISKSKYSIQKKRSSKLIMQLNPVLKVFYLKLFHIW